MAAQLCAYAVFVNELYAYCEHMSFFSIVPQIDAIIYKKNATQHLNICAVHSTLHPVTTLPWYCRQVQTRKLSPRRLITMARTPKKKHANHRLRVSSAYIQALLYRLVYFCRIVRWSLLQCAQHLIGTCRGFLLHCTLCTRSRPFKPGNNNKI